MPNVGIDISTRSYLSLVQSSPINQTLGQRGYYNSIPLASITKPLLDAVVNFTEYFGAKAAPYGSFTYSMEPFQPSILAHGGPSAYPPSRTRLFLPSDLGVAWADPAHDAFMHGVAVDAAAAVLLAASEQGQDLAGAAPYPNYAIYSTPLEAMYGENLGALRALKMVYDPFSVMGLAGGWKF